MKLLCTDAVDSESALTFSGHRLMQVCLNIKINGRISLHLKKTNLIFGIGFMKKEISPVPASVMTC